MRKIIQISITPATIKEYLTMYALCDDGTILYKEFVTYWDKYWKVAARPEQIPQGGL